MCAPEPNSPHGEHDALQECSYGCWYPRYAALAPASRVIQLDAGVAAFLQEDGLVLPDDSAALPQRAKPGDIIVQGVDYDPDDLYSSSTAASDSDPDSDAHSSSDGDGEAQLRWPQRFPDLHASLAAAIAELGGAVAPRLNWSSPTDALWLSSSNTLKCTNPDEVLLLLKGSDRVAHDLEQLQQMHASLPQQQQQQQQQQQHPQQPVPSSSVISSSRQPPPAQLVLRRWCGLAPEWEFRVFVSQHRVAAISQRDPSQHFPQLASAAAAGAAGGEEGEGARHSLSGIKQRLLEFHASRIGSSFPLDSYVMDVYVPPRGPIQLLDFSPISTTTNPLCFDWEDLPYTHMHQQQQQRDQQQQQQQDHSSSLQQQHPPHSQQQHDGCSASSSRDSSSSSSSSSSSGSRRSVELRVVEHEGMIVPGARVATGMPYDMLGLPDAVGAVMAAMQQQQLQ